MLVGFGLFLLTFVIAIGAVLCAAIGLDAFRRVRGSAPVEDEPQEPVSSLIRDEQTSSISFWAVLLDRLNVTQKIRHDITRANLTWSVGRVTLLMLLCASAAAALAARQVWLPAWAVAIIAILAGLVPWLYIRRRGTIRLRHFEEQFPDALDCLARAMRAGHTFSSALDAVCSETQEPVTSEFQRLSAEGNLATSWKDALASFADRVPLLEVDMFVSAVVLHMRTGGRLTHVIEQLSESMRETVALRGEVRAAAAHGKLTGAILTALPIVIAIAMLVVNPGYLAVLINHPHGKEMILAAIISLVLAHLVIRKIVDIKV